MSVAFAVISQASHTPSAGTDAEEAKYFKVADIFEKNIKNKFLHLTIIKFWRML